jgi:hypothetical protein
MRMLKGPALFLGQFSSDEAPFNTWDGITKWAADCGYVGVQVPSWDSNLINLETAGLLRHPQGGGGSERDRCDRAFVASPGSACGGASRL